MRRPAPREKETQGTAKPSLSLAVSDKPGGLAASMLTCRAEGATYSLKVFLVYAISRALSIPEGRNRQKSCGGAEDPADGRKRNGGRHDGAKHADPAAPGGGGGSRRAAVPIKISYFNGRVV